MEGGVELGGAVGAGHVGVHNAAGKVRGEVAQAAAAAERLEVPEHAGSTLGGSRRPRAATAGARTPRRCGRPPRERQRVDAEAPEVADHRLREAPGSG